MIYQKIFQKKNPESEGGKKVKKRIKKAFSSSFGPALFNPVTNSYKRLSGKRPLLAARENLVSSNLNITIGEEVKVQKKRKIDFEPKKNLNDFFLNGVKMDRKRKSGKQNKLSVEINSKIIFEFFRGVWHV